MNIKTETSRLKSFAHGSIARFYLSKSNTKFRYERMEPNRMITVFNKCLNGLTESRSDQNLIPKIKEAIEKLNQLISCTN
ncbi:MAG: hypothetical protein ABI851_15995 [Saprospiraceae bacterium]